MGGSSKGSAFEREMAVSFSKWWTQGAHDDVFWRVMGSGARATSRTQKQQSTTHASFGDMESTTPDSAPFAKLVVLEFKRGYGQWNLQDMVDCRSMKQREWYDFAQQTLASWKASKRPFWAVVFQRDGHKAMIAMSPKFYGFLLVKTLEEGSEDFGNLTDIRLNMYYESCDYSCVAMKLEDWFSAVPPKIFKEESYTRDQNVEIEEIPST